MPFLSFANRFTPWFDRATGAAGLKTRVRRQLVADQLDTIYRLLPALAIVSTLVVCILLTAAYGQQRYGVIVAWSIAQFVAMAYGLSSGMPRDLSTSLAGKGPSVRAIGIVVFAFVLGTLWAVVPFLMGYAGFYGLTLVTLLASVGALCVGGFVFAAYPPAAVAYLLPTLAGAQAVSSFVPERGTSALVAVTLVSFAALIALVSVRQTRLLVAHLRTESTIRDQRNVISLLLREFEENSADWLWEFDAAGMIDRVSDRFGTKLGGTEHVRGRDFLEFMRDISIGDGAAHNELAADIADRRAFNDRSIQLRTADGDRWWRLAGKPVYDEAGAYAGYVGIASDVTAETIAERRIAFLAHNDSLTGLMNRTRFNELLGSAVARLERYGTPFAVLYLDFDDFKAINDGLGHLTGDRLLSQAARRIKAALRDSDIVARLGGDEFAAILTGVSRRDDIEPIAARMVRDISTPYEIDGQSLTIGVSIGIAIAPQDGAAAEQLLRHADLALYRAKTTGRLRHCYFEAQMDNEVRERRLMETELREAIAGGQLALNYQPLVSADSGCPIGFEALVRWNHPVRGAIGPSVFIPLAEQSGLISGIGDWSILRACREAVSWPQSLFVAVNLSARHFQGSDIVSVVRDALAETGLAAGRLEIEITESLLLENPDQVIVKLRALKALGVTIALDHFGTGYSSLSYLLKFPFDKIKIDKSFVDALAVDPAAHDILRTIATLGRTLNMQVTVEGVETHEQIEALRDLSLDFMQGYYFARPLDQAGLAAYLLKNLSDKSRDQAKPARALRVVS
ncbi:MAG: EAL domain-containing protein [Rhizobiaceae bacterium]